MFGDRMKTIRSQSTQILALLGVFLDIGIQTGVPLHLIQRCAMV